MYNYLEASESASLSVDQENIVSIKKTKIFYGTLLIWYRLQISFLRQIQSILLELLSKIKFHWI